MENRSYDELKVSLSAIPAKSLNFASRLILSKLNDKKALMSRKGFARDYRGLAELMGFSYVKIKAFEKDEDRLWKIFDSWETRPDATLDKLIDYLEDMDCYDIIEELIPLLDKNKEAYLKSLENAIKNDENPVQASEIVVDSSNLQLNDFHTYTTGESVKYDAYVFYAEDDISLVVEFADKLESPRIGLKLFICDRDLLAGSPKMSVNIELLKNRFRNVLIFLTPNFMKSPELESLINFAESLTIEEKRRILIPVILAPCEIPPVLHYISKIDFTKEFARDWMWEKLLVSLLPDDRAFSISEVQ